MVESFQRGFLAFQTVESFKPCQYAIHSLSCAIANATTSSHDENKSVEAIFVQKTDTDPLKKQDYVSINEDDSQEQMNLLGKIGSRAVSLFLYPAGIIDLAIQILALPLISVIGTIYNAFTTKPYYRPLQVCLLPLTIPIYLACDLLRKILCMIRDVFLVIIPCKTIYAVIHGRDAAIQYFRKECQISLQYHNTDNHMIHFFGGSCNRDLNVINAISDSLL